MDKRYGLDAISYLTDPLGPSGRPSIWTEPTVEERRRVLLQAIALKRRELESLESDLSQLAKVAVEPESLRPKSPLRRFLGRLIAQES